MCVAEHLPGDASSGGLGHDEDRLSDDLSAEGEGHDVGGLSHEIGGDVVGYGWMGDAREGGLFSLAFAGVGRDGAAG
jgi:hypothetical protein